MEVSHPWNYRQLRHRSTQNLSTDMGSPRSVSYPTGTMRPSLCERRRGVFLSRQHT